MDGSRTKAARRRVQRGSRSRHIAVHIAAGLTRRQAGLAGDLEIPLSTCPNFPGQLFSPGARHRPVAGGGIFRLASAWRGSNKE